jgi:hypothetical protein
MKRMLPYIMLLSALSLAATAAYYSIFGLSKLFSSQANAVIFMASILEASKLVTASYLHRHWTSIKWIAKTYLTAAMIILMAITSLGIYGFLVSSYQETAYKMTAVDSKLSVLELKKARYETNLGAIQAEKESLNNNISELTKGLSNNVISYLDRDGNRITTTSTATRKALQSQLDSQIARRDDLSDSEIAAADSVSSIEMQILDTQLNNEVAAELGPLTYVSGITGASMDLVVNWFILLFIIVFDPLAVILLVSANRLLESKNEDASVPVAEKPEGSVTEERKAKRVEAPTQESSTETNPGSAPAGAKFKPHSLHNVWRSAKRKK